MEWSGVRDPHTYTEKKRKRVTKSTIHNAVTALPNLYRMSSDNNGAGNDRKRDKNVDPACVWVCVCAYNGNDDENKPILSAATVAVVTITVRMYVIVLRRGKELAEHLLGELLFSGDTRAHLLHDIFVLWLYVCVCAACFSLGKLSPFVLRSFIYYKRWLWC